METLDIRNVTRNNSILNHTHRSFIRFHLVYFFSSLCSRPRSVLYCVLYFWFIERWGWRQSHISSCSLFRILHFYFIFCFFASVLRFVCALFFCCFCCFHLKFFVRFFSFYSLSTVVRKLSSFILKIFPVYTTRQCGCVCVSVNYSWIFLFSLLLLMPLSSIFNGGRNEGLVFFYSQ